jgi:hypothetical protein
VAVQCDFFKLIFAAEATPYKYLVLHGKSDDGAVKLVYLPLKITEV